MVLVDWTIESWTNTPNPVNVHAERCGEKRICMSWTRTRGSGQYLGVRVNDYFLGYADVSNEELVIDDVDFSDIRLAVGSMNANYDLGEMKDLNIEGVVGSVPTSASLPW
jgi:hypothetical protein